MKKLTHADPLLVASCEDEQTNLTSPDTKVQKSTRELRSQQGVLQAWESRRDASRSAGDAERRLRRLEHEGQVRLGQHAIDIFVEQTVKTMRAQAAAHNQELNNRLLVQEVSGAHSLTAISAEGMIRQAEDHESFMQTVESKISSGSVKPDDGDRLLKRFTGLNALTESAQSHAISAALEDNAAYFQDARKKVRPS